MQKCGNSEVVLLLKWTITTDMKPLIGCEEEVRAYFFELEK